MLVKSLARKRPLMAAMSSQRAFTYDQREIRRNYQNLMRKINILKMFTKHKEFNYEEPNMTYDKATGNVTIHESKQKNRRIIKTFDDADNLRK